jgi:hypothetical protein
MLFIFLMGRRERFSHDWGDQMQTSDATQGATFYLGNNGYTSMSGGLNHPIDKSKIVQTGKMEDAWFWMFHHDFPGAGRGVDFQIRVPVFEYCPDQTVER